MGLNTPPKQPAQENKAIDDSLTAKTNALFNRTDLSPEEFQRLLKEIISDYRKDLDDNQ
jgi:hypothetical protein